MSLQQVSAQVDGLATLDSIYGGAALAMSGMIVFDDVKGLFDGKALIKQVVKEGGKTVTKYFLRHPGSTILEAIPAGQVDDALKTVGRSINELGSHADQIKAVKGAASPQNRHMQVHHFAPKAVGWSRCRKVCKTR